MVGVFDCVGARHLLPLAWVPFAQAWFALAISAALAPAAAGFFQNVAGFNAPAALAAGLLIGTLPIGDILLVSNTAYSIWAMLGVLLLSACNPPSTQTAGLAASLTWRLLFVLSNPLSIVLIPIWIGLAVWHRRGSRLLVYHALLAMVTATYVVFGVSHVAGAGLDWASLHSLAETTLRLAVDKSLLTLVVLRALRINLHAVPVAALVVLFVAVTSLVFACRLTGRNGGMRRIVSVMLPLYCILAVSFLCAVGRLAQGGSGSALMSGRYYFLPRLFWAVLLVICANDLLLQWPSGNWRRHAVMAMAVLAFCLMWRRGLGDYRTHNAAESTAIRTFLVDADAGNSTAILRYPRTDPSGDWSLIIDRSPLR